MRPVVYRLRLLEPLGCPATHQARYYIGSTTNLKARLEAHRQGRRGCEGGANMTAAAVARGIPFELDGLWPCPSEGAARELERRLKRRKNNGALRPPVQGDALQLYLNA